MIIQVNECRVLLLTSDIVNVTTNSPSQNYSHLDDHNLPTHHMIDPLVQNLQGRNFGTQTILFQNLEWREG